jgi:hypothetical protein
VICDPAPDKCQGQIVTQLPGDAWTCRVLDLIGSSST